MRGWKTWLAAIGSIAYGVGGYLGGAHDVTTMVKMIVAGIAMVGIGHKIEKVMQ